MANYVDLYLGSLLILSGFILSLLNFKRIVKKNKVSYPTVLLSENILLTCIGIAFVTRSVYKLSPINYEVGDLEERSKNMMKTEEVDCNFTSILMSYGPLIVSLVNSFLSLIIDNYMHYRMIADVKRNEDENEVRELTDNYRENSRINIKILFSFMKQYFTFTAVSLQWILPTILALAMYLIDIRQMTIMSGERSFSVPCMALLDVNKENCTLLLNANDSFQIQNEDFLITFDRHLYNTSDKGVDNIIENVYNVLASLQNDSYYADITVTTAPLLRKPKQYHEHMCMKICYLENKNLLLYIFGVSIVSFFVPITISAVILTKIHIMDVKNQNVKTYVSRELLYNVLFWTPVMFDTLFSIMLCSYSMNGMRTSIFNVVANVYQAVKNFVNAKYFKDNSIVPV